MIALFQPELAPSGAAISLIVAISFFLVFLAVAFVAYKALKRTVKFAVRMAITGLLILIAIAGSFTLWYFSSGAEPKLKPPAEKRSR